MFKKQQGKQIIQEYLESENTIKRYIKGNLLGKGGFAKCYEFTSEQTGIKYAAKVIEKASLNKPKAKEKLQSEIKIHKSLSHPSIVQFEHFFEDEKFVYILLEVCRPQTLNDLLKRRKRITEFEVKYYIFQIAEALKYVHSNKVIHRDLKLGNLFLTDQLHIKLGDFGLAAKLHSDSERKKTTCGTPNYLAPEILSSKNGHSYEVDIWSLGVLSFALLFGRPPFETNDLKMTYNKIKTCSYAFPETANVSQMAKRFITKILQLEPHKRPTLDEILEDDFIQSIQIPKYLPLATISIPPSTNFMKKFEKSTQNDSNYNSLNRHEDSSTSNGNSFGTLERNRIMMSTDKLELATKNPYHKESLNMNKEQTAQHLHLQRASSAAGLIQRKKSSFKQHLSSSNTPIQPKQTIPIRVIYFEQNPKFGVSYMLSTNAIGMRYNDSTCLITNAIQSKVKYTVLDVGLHELNSEIHEYQHTPTALNKKVKIISHYSKQLKKRKEQIEGKVSNEMRIQFERQRTKENHENIMNVFVVRSLKTTKANFLEFNTGFVQVIFEDSSEIIFKETQIVTYINKFSELKQFKFDTLSTQSEDVKKRMTYALNVIEKVRKSGPQAKENKPQHERPLGRCVSTAKLSINEGLNKELHKNYSSTAKLKTKGLISQKVALKQVSNRYY